MISTIIAMFISVLSVFFLIGKTITEYEANDLNRIKYIQHNVYIDIAIALLCAMIPGISFVILFLTCKFIFLSTLNYEALLKTKA